MLTLSDLWLAKWVLKMASKLCILPIRFIGDWEIKPLVNDAKKERIFKFWFYLHVTQNLYVILRTTFFLGDFDLFLGIINIIMVLWYTMFSVVAYSAFIVQRELNCAVFNEIIQLIRDANSMGGGKGGKSVAELLCCYCALALYSCMGMYATIYNMNMNTPILLISLVPPPWRNFLTIAPCLFVDSLTLFVSLTLSVYCGFVMLAFVVSFTNFTWAHIKICEKTEGLGMTQVLADCLAAIRRLQVQLRNFTLVFSNFLYHLKIFLLMTSVMYGYGIIKIHTEHPKLCTFYAIAGFDCNLFYVVTFGAYYEVTTTIEQLKEVIRLGSRELGVRTHDQYKLEVKKMLRSVPVMAVTLGGFHAVERETIPLFIDFVVQQIVSLLVM